MEDTKTKVPVTEATLKKRVNRALAKKGQVLRKPRGEYMALRIGPYYLTDRDTGLVVERNVTLTEFSIRIGVLMGFEELVE